MANAVPTGETFVTFGSATFDFSRAFPITLGDMATFEEFGFNQMMVDPASGKARVGVRIMIRVLAHLSSKVDPSVTEAVIGSLEPDDENFMRAAEIFGQRVNEGKTRIPLVARKRKR